MAVTIDRDAIGTNTSMFSGHLPFIFSLKSFPVIDKIQNYVKIYICGKQISCIAVKMCYLGGSNINQLFYMGPFNMWIDRYKSTWNLVLKLWENREFGLRKNVGTMFSFGSNQREMYRTLGSHR